MYHNVYTIEGIDRVCADYRAYMLGLKCAKARLCAYFIDSGINVV